MLLDGDDNAFAANKTAANPHGCGAFAKCLSCGSRQQAQDNQQVFLSAMLLTLNKPFLGSLAASFYCVKIIKIDSSSSIMQEEMNLIGIYIAERGTPKPCAGKTGIPFWPPKNDMA